MKQLTRLLWSISFILIYTNPMIWLEDTNDEMEVISRYGVKAK